MSYAEILDNADYLPEIFEIVKKVVRDITGAERPGLMLGISDLGGQPGSFVGAFYPVSSNIIVINKTPLGTVRKLRPELYNEYCFHLLLHEYLHSLGILDETKDRQITAFISEKAFGSNHPVTVIAKDFNRVFPEIFYASASWRPAAKARIDIIDNFNDGSVNYIG